MIVIKNDRDVMIREINRCLKKDRIVYSIWRDKTDYFYEKGTKVEDDNTFILQENKCGIYNFRDKEKIIKFYNEYGFEIYNIEKRFLYRTFKG